MTEFQIRPARPEEAGTLTEIALAAKGHWGYPRDWIESWKPLLTIHPADILDGEVAVCMVEGDITGFYQLSVRERRAVLDDLWVRPEWIGRGLGRALFRHALASGQRQGAAVLEIEADPNAQAFYEKMGARKIRERRTEVNGSPRLLPILEIQL
jgi:ribosomal protein S18 acetylase RimI-like enzyme